MNLVFSFKTAGYLEQFLVIVTFLSRNAKRYNVMSLRHKFPSDCKNMAIFPRSSSVLPSHAFRQAVSLSSFNKIILFCSIQCMFVLVCCASDLHLGGRLCSPSSRSLSDSDGAVALRSFNAEPRARSIQILLLNRFWA